MFKRLSALVGAGSMALAILIAPAAQAAGPDDLLNVRDGVCDFAAAGLGHGSATDPFSISTPKQLAEMHDCSLRQYNITNAVGNGTSVTFTSDHTFGVGQIVNIDNMDPANYNMKAARITAVTATSFTVLSPITDAYVGSGTATDTHSFYSIDADINLAGGTESWNLVQEATITNAVGDGSNIVYTAANNFTVGQNIIIEGIEPMAYSVGRATITAADANSFTISNGATGAYVSGGKAYANGWQPITGRDNRFEHATVLGNDHTISNLTIHRNESNQGLFGYMRYAKVQDLNMTGIMVSTSGDQWIERTGGLVGVAEYSSFNDISVSGTVYGRFNVGLLGGRLFSELSNITATGTVAGRATYVSDQWNSQGQNFGGVGGQAYGAISNITADVDVDGLLRTGVAGQPVAQGRQIGGAFGTVDGAFRNITSSGDVTGTVQVGGVFGYNCCGDTINAVNTGDVYGVTDSFNRTINQVGGVFGTWDCCGAVRDSYSTGDVIVQNTNASAEIRYIGGFSGTNWCCGLMVNSYATGDVIVNTAGPAAYGIGGFLGVYDCCNNLDGVYATGDVTVNNGYSVGGLIGVIESSESGIENSYYEGTVTVGYDGVAQVGGFIGYSEYDITIVNSYANANVIVTPFTPGSTAGSVGGLVGAVGGMLIVRDSYFRGSVSGTYRVGGLVGWNEYGLIDIKRSYVSASVTDNSVGPTVDAVANGVYTDVHGTSIYDSTVAGAVTSSTGFHAKTSAELKTKSVLEGLGWKFDNAGGPWKFTSGVNAGFPHLVRPNYGGGAEALPAATVSWAPLTKVTTRTTAPSVLATSNSTGAITYAVTSAGATGCTVNANTGALTFTGAGNCTVTATVASDGSYAEGSVSVTFQVTAANCAALNLGTMRFEKSRWMLTAAQKRAIRNYTAEIVDSGCGAVIVTGKAASLAVAKKRAFAVKNNLLARLTTEGVSVRFVTKWSKGANTVSVSGRNS